MFKKLPPLGRARGLGSENLRAMNTALGEVPYFMSVQLLRKQICNVMSGLVGVEESWDEVMLAFIRALPTTTVSIPGSTDCKLVKLSNPGSFGNDLLSSARTLLILLS